jgi:hypothetical protein
LLQNISVFFKAERLYLYLEDADRVSVQQKDRFDVAIQSLLKKLAPESGCSDWHRMHEVFHTD